MHHILSFSFAWFFSTYTKSRHIKYLINYLNIIKSLIIICFLDFNYSFQPNLIYILRTKLNPLDFWFSRQNYSCKNKIQIPTAVFSAQLASVTSILIYTHYSILWKATFLKDVFSIYNAWMKSEPVAFMSLFLT